MKNITHKFIWKNVNIRKRKEGKSTWKKEVTPDSDESDDEPTEKTFFVSKITSSNIFNTTKHTRKDDNKKSWDVSFFGTFLKNTHAYRKIV